MHSTKSSLFTPPQIQDFNSLLEHCILCLSDLTFLESFELSVQKFKNSTLLDLYYEVTKLPKLNRNFPCKACRPCCEKLAECYKFITITVQAHSFISEKLGAPLTCNDDVLLNNNKVNANSSEIILSNDTIKSENSDINLANKKFKDDMDPVALSDNFQGIKETKGDKPKREKAIRQSKINKRSRYSVREVVIQPKEDPVIPQAFPINQEIIVNDLMIQVYPEPRNVLQCNLCDYNTIYAEILNAHNFTKHPLKAIKCSFCTKTFETKWKYINHPCNSGEKGFTNFRSKGTMVCSKCLQQFPNTIDLFNHLNRHDNDSEFVCFLCKRDFQNGYDLDNHISHRHKFEIIL